MTGKYFEADRRHRYFCQTGNWEIITQNILCAVKCEMTVPTKSKTINVLYRVLYILPVQVSSEACFPKGSITGERKVDEFRIS